MTAALDPIDQSKIERLTELLEAGVHYGHQTKRWNPKMRSYILEERNAIYIINLEHTLEQLDAARKFLRDTVSKGGRVLFVGTKRQAQEAVKEAAEVTGQFYINQRWLGGTLTNLLTIRRSVARWDEIERIVNSPEFARMNKQEASALRRELHRLQHNLSGIRHMETLPSALIVIDTNREEIAVHEAARLGIPVIGIVDTNSDPDKITFPIPGNDDAIRSIRIILQHLVDAIVEARGGLASSPSKTPAPAALEAVAE